MTRQERSGLEAMEYMAQGYLVEHREYGGMSVSGLCQVCEAAQARFSCGRCGQLVCGDHYERETGMCLECTRESGMGDRGPSPADFHR